ncbi:hypothetical protein LAZ67_18001186 [Cordylochernes scorpioides]|uniref:Uncharacterized protein n=1 Tax=Cordylochernes scorpioides TaxID=51811 RepID=A0ABY6LFN8_9ARAC|nr:hypothetical protein LAZ67_18001186 [Cordylochernes scorpioides]
MGNCIKRSKRVPYQRPPNVDEILRKYFEEELRFLGSRQDPEPRRPTRVTFGARLLVRTFEADEAANVNRGHYTMAEDSLFTPGQEFDVPACPPPSPRRRFWSRRQTSTGVPVRLEMAALKLGKIYVRRLPLRVLYQTKSLDPLNKCLKGPAQDLNQVMK